MLCVRRALTLYLAREGMFDLSTTDSSGLTKSYRSENYRGRATRYSAQATA